MLALLLMIALIGIGGTTIAPPAMAVYRDYQALQPYLHAGSAELLQPQTLDTLETLVHRSEADLRALRSAAGPLLTLSPWLAWIPVYGGDIGQSSALLDYAIEAAATGSSGLQTYRAAMADISAQETQAKSMSRGQLLLATFENLRPEFARLQADLARTAMARKKIDVDRLSSRTGGLIRRADQVSDLAAISLGMTDVFPVLLGAQGPRRYLLIAQNSDELRATGGYISGVALIQVDKGQIRTAEYRDSYAVENYAKPHPWPPRPLVDYMGAEMWTVRDANWSPDFPTSARTIEQLYELNQGVSVDGVIAVNPGALQRLVGALAPISIPGYAEKIDAANFMDRMEYYFFSPEGAGEGSDWWSHRKDFMGVLMQSIIGRLNGEGAAVAPARLAQALWDSVTARDILIYLNEPRAASTLRQLGWDGALPEASSITDSVFVVDSNVGFNKADRQIERAFDYHVELVPGQRPEASLRLSYRNLNLPSTVACQKEIKYQATYAEMQNTCYWDYVRIYVPLNSAPIAATRNISAALEAPDLNYTVLSAYLTVPRGDRREVQFDYTLPFAAGGTDSPLEYTLTWRKQPGSAPAPVHVTLTKPAAFQLDQADPVPVSQSDTRIEFNLAADRDSRLSVRLIPAPVFPVQGAVLLIFVGIVLIGGAAAFFSRRRLISRFPFRSR